MCPVFGVETFWYDRNSLNLEEGFISMFFVGIHTGNLITCCMKQSKTVNKIRKYHNHKLQANPWHREEEPHNNHETP